MKIKFIFFILVLFGGTLLFSFSSNNLSVQYSKYSGGGEDFNHGLTLEENSLFSGSGVCAGCHGHDPSAFAGTTPEGTDVNLVDDWRASMMANAAKDPFWRAKVSHEISVNPGHQEELEDKCLSCHASQGRFAAIHDGATHYSMAEMLEDSMALDGVSCGSCHQQRPENIGNAFSGELVFDNDTIYGPYGGPDDEVGIIFEGPMQSFVGYTPVYDSYVDQSEMCAACHTLITESVDLEGEFTGSTFVEQATYHEWLNSSYNGGKSGVECQGCHLPRINEPVVLSTNYLFLQGRQPFGRHFMVGGNSFMLNIFKNNIDTLGLSATESQFQNAIDRTIDQLQNHTLEIEISALEFDDDSARYEVLLTNLAGHKFPSGYPARRAFIEFVAVDELGDTIFQSGVLQSDFEVMGQNSDYEPHYDLITDESQVQIYELVMGDVNNNVTTVLERAHHSIKDNRLVPLGFSFTHPSYDTIAVAGLVLNDDNFNEVESGTDKIQYHFPLNGFSGDLLVSASVFYQSDPPKWNEELFAVDTPEINFYQELYEINGAAPVLIQSDSHETIGVGLEEQLLFTDNVEIINNPFVQNITLNLKRENNAISIYNSQGKLVKDVKLSSGTHEIALPSTSGVYILSFHIDQQVFIERIIKFNQ